MGTASSTGSSQNLPMSSSQGMRSPPPAGQTTYQSSFATPGMRAGGPNTGYTTYTGPAYQDRVNATHGSGQYFTDPPHSPYPPQMLPQQPPPAGFRPEVTDLHNPSPGNPLVTGYGYPPQQDPRTHSPLYPQIDQISNSENQDCSSDVVLSRLMAAEEYLMNMEDTDRRITVMSEVNDRASVLEQLKEALGIRGHLQDELLRILAMLSQDSPDLNCLSEFEEAYPKVVEKLRELKEKERVLRVLSKTRAMSAFGHRADGEDGDEGDPEADTAALRQIDPSLMRTVEEKLEEVDIVAATTDPLPGRGHIDESNVTEGELKAKHKAEMDNLQERFLQEEQTVSSNFAERVLQAGSSGPEAVDRLLHEHAISMQALRDRQNNERRRIMSAVGARRQHGGQGTSGSGAQGQQTENMKKVQKAYVAQINFGSNGKMTVQEGREGHKGGKKPVGTAAVIRQGSEGESENNKDWNSDDELQDLINVAAAVQASLETSNNGPKDDFGDFGSDNSDIEETNELRRTFTKDMWENRKNLTTDDFRAMLDDFRKQEEERKRMRQADSHDAKLKAKLAASKQNKSKTLGEDSPSSEPDDVETKKATGKAVDKDAEFAAYLRDADQEGGEAQRVRDSERERMKQKLKDKLKNKKNTSNDSVEELTAEIDQAIEDKDAAFVEKLRRRGMNQVDIDELLRRHLQEAEEIRRRKFAERSRLDERLKEILGNKNNKDLEQMDDGVQDDLAGLDADLARTVRGRSNITAGEVDELLSEHRRQQEQIIRQRALEKQRANEKLKGKLKGRAELEAVEELGEIEDDEQFFARLQALQKSGELSQDVFQELLQQYMSKKDNQRQQEMKEQRRRLREEEKQRERETAAAAETATSLVTEHQEKTKQVQNTRQRERAALDAKLQEKLRKSKAQKQAVPEDDMYDF